ncbi:MAG TPA: phenylalanine--tRNA ligase subunit alpha [Patescibacteria group bacterium]|nr:phenylalanine--tRNA ligase subunit alpha [Patescibacteria group bacterium]
MITSLHELKTGIDTLRQEFESDSREAEEKREVYLGKNGKFKELTNALKTLIPESRRDAGRMLNQLKEWLNEQMPTSAQDAVRSTQFVDPTLPGLDLHTGHMHPISLAIEEITHIFEKIGFSRARYPEVDGDHYVFEALNMPPSHPARDEWETFFVDMPKDSKLGEIVLSTHTSNGQVREMERLGTPPIRMINIARCYRRQADVTHTPMFHQFEGLVVDKGINIQHLKGTIEYFAREFYGPTAKSRIRPFHFQFTEPSFEVDFSCTICDGKGILENGEKCRFCKSGWHEVGGAGMVHPNVLLAGGIDPEEYTGFAFGWGIERTYTLRPGLHIDDIRSFYNGDLSLLNQF